jgi:uncharacterized membrane protein
MNFVLFLISMLLPTAAGYVLVFDAEPLTGAERLVFAFSLGTGLLSFYLYGLLYLGVPLTPPAVALFFAPVLVLGSFRRKELRRALACPARSPEPGLSSGQKVLFLAIAGLIAWKVLFLSFMNFSGPVLFSDAYTLWNYKAKVIFSSGFAAAAPGSEEILGGTARHYPLHLPIMRAWIAIVLGKWDDAWVNLHSLILFFCLLGLTYGFLKKRTGRLLALVFAGVLSGIPILVYNVASGYADMAVGYFFLAAAVMLFYWRETGKTRFLLFSGILTSVAMFTKIEGTAIVFPALLAAFLYQLFRAHYTWKQTLASMASFALSCVLIALWLRESHALNAIASISGFRESAISFHREGLAPLVEHLFLFRSHNLFWLGLILICLLKRRTLFRPDVRFFFLPAVLALGACLFVFLFTPNVAWLMDGTTINRTMLVVIPVLALTCGLLFARDGSADGATGKELNGPAQDAGGE